MVGEFPGLAKLDSDGNVRATADLRGVYGTPAGDWFGVDPASVLPDARGIGTAVAEWRGTLTRGRWKRFCALPGHENAGMRAVLTVR